MRIIVFTILTFLILTSLVFSQNQRGLNEKHTFFNHKFEKEERQIKEHDPIVFQKQNKSKVNTERGILYRPSVVYINDSTIRWTYTYDASGNMLTQLYEWWENGAWVNSTRYSYTYDASGNRLTYLFESWQNGAWVNKWRYSYTYDASGNMLTYLYENWSNGAWVNFERSTYTYDGSGNRLTSLFERWRNNEWVNFERSTYTYDASGNMLTQLYEWWENGAWVRGWRYTYTYDNYNNAVSGKGEQWSNNIWVNKIGFDMYYNNKTDHLFVGGYNCTVQYTQFTDVKDELNNSLVFTLNQNYPNPFNPSTNINFTLPKTEFVTLKIYDILGKEITTLINEELNAGNHTKIWDAKNLSSGVYFYKLTAGKFTETKKMVLVR